MNWDRFMFLQIIDDLCVAVEELEKAEAGSNEQYYTIGRLLAMAKMIKGYRINGKIEIS